MRVAGIEGAGKATFMPLKTLTAAFRDVGEAGTVMLAKDRGFSPSETGDVCLKSPKFPVAACAMNWDWFVSIPGSILDAEFGTCCSVPDGVDKVGFWTFKTTGTPNSMAEAGVDNIAAGRGNGIRPEEAGRVLLRLSGSPGFSVSSLKALLCANG